MQDRLISGDALNFTTTLPDYPNATYTLVYRLVPRATGTPIDLTCTAGTEAYDHRCAAAASTTALWTAGEYSWFSWVEKAGERYAVDDGACTIAANPAVASTYDARTQAEVALADAKAALASFSASGGRVRRYSIAGREIEFDNGGELVKLVSYWQAEVWKETASKRRSKGLDDGRRIYMRVSGGL